MDDCSERAGDQTLRELSLVERLARLPVEARAEVVANVPENMRGVLARSWGLQARPSQLAPDGDWGVWLILAGRGFGKTRTGAEWVSGMAARHPGARFALVGPTAHDVQAVMMEGESGILAVSPDWNRPDWKATKRELHWPNGSMASVISAVEPDQLRGPQFHFAWCDEIAAWPKVDAVWSNLRMGLRLGERPQVVVTTTPRPIPFLTKLMEASGVVVTRGSTFDNKANLPTAFLEDMGKAYGQSALGRQELFGEILQSQEGALWSRDGLEMCRISKCPEMVRIVVGVDPPAGPGGCGIVVAGLDANGVEHILADASLRGSAPDVWAKAVHTAFMRYGADKIVVETNNGGDMVEAMLRAAEVSLPIKQVKASRGKAARAEPVAALYAAGRVRHVGMFSDLEDEMCGLILGGGYVGPGSSPDRADALVWALTELMLGQRATGPGVRVLG